MADDKLVDKRIEEIRARIAAASPGPWEIIREWPESLDGGDAYPYSIDGPVNGSALRMGGEFAKRYRASVTEVCDLSDADADFIAGAREDVPFLLAQLAAKDAEIAQWKSVAAAFKDEAAQWRQLAAELET